MTKYLAKSFPGLWSWLKRRNPIRIYFDYYGQPTQIIFRFNLFWWWKFLPYEILSRVSDFVEWSLRSSFLRTKTFNYIEPSLKTISLKKIEPFLIKLLQRKIMMPENRFNWVKWKFKISGNFVLWSFEVSSSYANISKCFKTFLKEHHDQHYFLPTKKQKLSEK